MNSSDQVIEVRKISVLALKYTFMGQKRLKLSFWDEIVKASDITSIYFWTFSDPLSDHVSINTVPNVSKNDHFFNKKRHADFWITFGNFGHSE